MTRDNMMSLIPPDEEEAACLAEGCAVDIGRAIGAEYVSSGSIGKFGKKFTISVELYETMGGKLISSIVFESEDIDGLLNVIRKEAKPLFQSILMHNVKKTSETKVKTGINVSEQSSGMAMSKWVGIGLSVVGIGMGIYGIVQESEYKKLNEDYLNATGNFDAKWKKAEDAKSSRNIGYILGTALLAGGVTVYFVF